MTSDIPERVLEFVLRCDSYRENARTMLEENRLLMRLRQEFTTNAEAVPLSSKWIRRRLPD